jgi:hypothetical protein
MSIDRTNALLLFTERYRSPDLQIYRISQTARKPLYGVNSKAWFIEFSLERATRIGPSSVLCISQSDGRVLYEGLACDEG